MNCPSCKRDRVHKRGTKRDRQRWHCPACNHYWIEGTRKKRSLLTPQEMLDLRIKGESDAAIARLAGVSRSAVGKALRKLENRDG